MITSPALSGDWGKAPVDKTPIEECVDLGGVIEAGYHSDYIYKGYRLGRDSVSGSVDYTYEVSRFPSLWASITSTWSPATASPTS